MASSRITCWSCGLLYDRVFDRCPTEILGCGASKEPVMDDLETARREAMRAYKALFHLIGAARRDGYEHTTDAARRAVEKISAAVDSIDLIIVSLRNDKSAKRDALNPKAVHIEETFERVECRCPSRMSPVDGVCPGCDGTRPDNDMAVKS